MFADTYSATRSAPSLANAYRQVGTETGVSGASPHKLIQMLFDGFQEAVAQARGALRSRVIEAKGRAISRALRIVDEGLHAGLNMSAGGELAADLDALYTYVALRLTHANLHNDEAALDECVRLIEPIRSAWAAIGPQVNGVRQ
ncbi:MAG: flagellar export chaperone FliS [Pseudomonadota bacterium]|nr:flagellar export chaperone FliS [Pseudomonadota bacterium]